MSRPRIAMVITRSDAIGGSQIHVRDMARALHRDGYRVRIMVGGTGPFVALLRREGLDVCPLPHLRGPVDPRADLRALVELRRALESFGPDLIALHTAKAGLLGRLAALGLGAPTVHCPHGWAFVDGVPRAKALVFRSIERLAAPLADRVITVSEFSRRLALEAGIGPARHIRCVPNGVPDVAPSLRARPCRGTPTMIVVARLDAPKDPRVLLRALATLRDRSWTLEWVGDGPLREPAEHLAEHLDLADRCRFVGARDDVAQRLARASLLVLPTRHEALPLTVLEAMRAGLPVVASAVGGIPEAVLDGVTGRLARPGDPAALALALAPLLDDPSARRCMGDAGRRRYEAQFSFARQYAATLDIYRELLPAPSALAQPLERAHATI